LPRPKANSEPLIRNISDTARWVATYRARETERADAVFHDPFARRLAGERGEQIAKALPRRADNSWAMVTRTHVMDEMIRTEIQRGTDMVVNIAAGLDTRPYRMQLPSGLQWVEVDLPGILDYKDEILKSETPVCLLERVRLDLSDAPARRNLFEQLGRRAKNALVITEGLIVYLEAEQVAGLAQDLAGTASFRSWLLDLPSPPLLRMLNKRMSPFFYQDSPFKFAPEEGPEFFAQYGWKPADLRSLLKNAARLRRLPFLLRIFACLPETEKSRRKRPWSGIGLFRNSRTSRTS
jgi:methyltransferase (TIGR00027 family)